MVNVKGLIPLYAKCWEPYQRKINWTGRPYLGSMTHAYNCTKHSSTTYSPYYLMFGRQPRLPIDLEMGLPIDGLGDTCSTTRFVHKLKQRLNYAYKRAKEASQKQAQKYKFSYANKIKGSQLQVDDLVLVKRVAWKGRHKIQNKWEPDEYIVIDQPNKGIPVYKVKPVGNGKERVLRRNLLLSLGIKFVPDTDQDSDSEQEKEIEVEPSLVEKQSVSEKVPQTVHNMIPLAQSDFEHGQQELFSSKEQKGTYEKEVSSQVDHVTPVEYSYVDQKQVETPTAISTGKLIDPDFTLDSKYVIPIEDTTGSELTQSTNIEPEISDTSLVLLFMNENSNSLIKTAEFLDFVDELSQENESQSVVKEEGSSTEPVDTVPNFSHDTAIVDLSDSSKVDPTLEPVSITKSQDISTMPYLEGRSLENYVNSKNESQPASVHSFHKEDTTSAHESANITTEEGISVSGTKDCSSSNSASKIPTVITNDLSDSVSEIESVSNETPQSQNVLQSIEKSVIEKEKDTRTSTPKPPGSPPPLRRSSRRTRSDTIWVVK